MTATLHQSVAMRFFSRQQRERSGNGLSSTSEDELERTVVTQVRPVDDVTARDKLAEILADEEVVVLVVASSAAPERPLLFCVELPHTVEEAARREPIE